MSFTVKKIDGAGLAEIGSKLGNHGSAAVANFSAKQLAEDSLQGDFAAVVPLVDQVVVAKNQSGMNKRPTLAPR